jgi:hypothetical protein
MKLITLFSILVINILTLAGCASNGIEDKSDQLTNFIKGKTTIEEVKSALGPPISLTTSTDGRRILNYAFLHSQPRLESIVPAIGAFPGGADKRTNYVTLTFDKDGVLENYNQSEFNSKMGAGLIGGDYSAIDITLPQELQK